MLKYSYFHHSQIGLIVLHNLSCIRKSSRCSLAAQHNYQQLFFIVLVEGNRSQTCETASCGHGYASFDASISFVKQLISRLPFETNLTFMVITSISFTAYNSGKIFVFQKQETSLCQFPDIADLTFVRQTMRILEMGMFVVKYLLDYYFVHELNEFFLVKFQVVVRF